MGEFDVVATVSKYSTWHLLAAVPIGVASGLIGVFALLSIGFFRKFGSRVKWRLRSRGVPAPLATVLLATLGGALIGLIAVAFPLTLGDGTMQIKSVIKHSYKGKWPVKGDVGIKAVDITPSITLATLWGTLFSKLLCMGACLGLGFVGGQIVPCVYAGLCAGMIVSRMFPSCPVTLAVPCMMSAVPASFAPIPFTLIGLVVLVMVLDGRMAGPVFVATFVSFLTNCGIGITQRVLERQNDLKGFMTMTRNNNQHSMMRGSSKGRWRIWDHLYKQEESRAMGDVSDIIFAAEPGEIQRGSLNL